jgi:AcrR family transcriptional regulator
MSMASRAYGSRRRPERTEATRAKIVGAVHGLLADGTFHSSTMEQVAERAGVSRATLYQHFRSRLDLVDAICETFDANPALVEARQSVTLDATIEQSVRFWSSEDRVLAALYGAAALDPAAQSLVERQRNDRRREMERLVRTLRLRKGTALPALMILTSYETFRELRLGGFTDEQTIAYLQDAAHRLL